MHLNALADILPIGDSRTKFNLKRSTRAGTPIEVSLSITLKLGRLKYHFRFEDFSSSRL
jgi:hypothetical protein